MDWIVIAVVAYFLVALQVILDKFLLSSKRVSHPAIYAFYSGILSLATLPIFFPFGFQLVSGWKMAAYFLAGIIFTYGILCLFFALKKSEASKVTPVVGAVIPVITFCLAVIFLGENLNLAHIAGIITLIFGGLLISFDLPLKIGKKFFAGFGHSIFAGFLLAVAFTAFKYFFEQDSFSNVFIWTRLGLFLGALSLMIFPFWRRIIFASLTKFKKPEHENTRTGILFVFNKILGGTGSALTNYAISLGSVTVVNALVSVEYVFIFILGLLFSLWLPKIFEEKGKFWDIAQKIGAIIIITIGTILISLK
jgi:drug/metabolite transporter (DMT)-like permease